MEFNKIVEERITKIRETLTRKAEEYASDSNRFHNFDVAARVEGKTPEQALYGMMMKHIVSVIDLVEWSESCPANITAELVDEKIGDNICYLTLLEGLFKRSLDK